MICHFNKEIKKHAGRYQKNMKNRIQDRINEVNQF
jgi:hypothetical protein